MFYFILFFAVKSVNINIKISLDNRMNSKKEQKLPEFKRQFGIMPEAEVVRTRSEEVREQIEFEKLKAALEELNNSPEPRNQTIPMASKLEATFQEMKIHEEKNN